MGMWEMKKARYKKYSAEFMVPGSCSCGKHGRAGSRRARRR
jgi:hypothetical protein